MHCPTEDQYNTRWSCCSKSHWIYHWEITLKSSESLVCILITWYHMVKSINLAHHQHVGNVHWCICSEPVHNSLTFYPRILPLWGTTGPRALSLGSDCLPQQAWAQDPLILAWTSQFWTRIAWEIEVAQLIRISFVWLRLACGNYQNALLWFTLISLNCILQTNLMI